MFNSLDPKTEMFYHARKKSCKYPLSIKTQAQSLTKKKQTEAQRNLSALLLSVLQNGWRRTAYRLLHQTKLSILCVTVKVDGTTLCEEHHQLEVFTAL
jgi:hypothetical protein